MIGGFTKDNKPTYLAEDPLAEPRILDVRLWIDAGHKDLVASHYRLFVTACILWPQHLENLRHGQRPRLTSDMLQYSPCIS